MAALRSAGDGFRPLRSLSRTNNRENSHAPNFAPAPSTTYLRQPRHGGLVGNGLFRRQVDLPLGRFNRNRYDVREFDDVAADVELFQ